MPKVYPTPTGTEKGRANERETGEKMAVGVQGKHVRALSPAMIAILVIAAIIIFIVVYMLMRH